MSEVSKKDITAALNVIDKAYNPVRSLEDTKVQHKTIVILYDDCGRRGYTTFTYINDDKLQMSLTTEVANLTSSGCKNIRVIKGVELEYPFKL